MQKFMSMSFSHIFVSGQLKEKNVENSK